MYLRSCCCCRGSSLGCPGRRPWTAPTRGTPTSTRTGWESWTGPGSGPPPGRSSGPGVGTKKKKRKPVVIKVGKFTWEPPAPYSWQSWTSWCYKLISGIGDPTNIASVRLVTDRPNARAGVKMAGKERRNPSSNPNFHPLPPPITYHYH